MEDRNPNYFLYMPGPVSGERYKDWTHPGANDIGCGGPLRLQPCVTPGPIVSYHRTSGLESLLNDMCVNPSPSPLWSASNAPEAEKKTQDKQSDNDKHRLPVEEIRVLAFLKLLRFTETRTEDDSAYYIQYGGGKVSDLSTHPSENQKVNLNYPNHTVEGAYQIKRDRYDEAVKKGIVQDFTKESQDKIARWTIENKHALQDIQNGNLDNAFKRLKGIWTSLPGGSQSHITSLAAKQKFIQYFTEMYEQ